jgi:iron complex outermembrane receptor protein
MRARGEDRFYVYPDAGTGNGDISGVAAGLDAEYNKQFFTQISSGRLKFDLVYADRRKNDPAARYFTDPLVPGQYDRDRYLLVQAQYEDSLVGDTLHVSGRLFLGQERYTGIANYGTQFLTTGSGDWRGAELRLLSTALDRHKLMLGVEGQDNTRSAQT